MTFCLFPWTPNYFGKEVYSKKKEKKKKKKLPKRCVCVCVGGGGGGGGKFFPFRVEFITEDITKSRLYNFDPLKPHFYIVKLGFTGVYIIFLISAQKHRLWVLVRTASSRRF